MYIEQLGLVYVIKPIENSAVNFTEIKAALWIFKWQGL